MIATAPGGTRGRHLAKLGLIGAVLLLATAAVYTSMLIARRHQGMPELSRYNMSWLVSQTAREVTRLEAAIAAAQVPGSGVGEDDVRFRLDLVANRVGLLESGEFADFVATSPELGAIVVALRETAQGARALMDAPGARDRLPRMFASVSALGAPMSELAAATNARGGAVAAEDERTLKGLYRASAAILGALTLCGFGLAAMLVRRNRALWRRDRELHAQNARIAFMAHHDVLTGLPNRLLFHERLREALAGRRGDDPVALLCLDLDRFKHVNDTLGHPAGDALLRAVAGRLRDCVRDGDVVARLGGDEFAILPSHTGRPEQAEALARRIVEVLGRPYDLDGHRAIVGASVGIAVTGAGPNSADVLLKGADLALYQAKADGRGTYRFFENAMDARVQTRRAIELDLREALARGELEVFYQPLFHLEAGRVASFEALLRWRHPARGLVSPAWFIPIAEELGLIVPMGEWVLTRACEDAAAWPGDAKVAVNLSPVQFRDPDLAGAVRRALAASGLAPQRLELEITESALLQDSETVLAILHELRALGVRTALDDFGTGYSSLSYLRSFPFDKIKIDRSFVREMATRPDCLAIVNSVAELARKLGMTTTAEGVETEDQLAQVREAGCTEAQGYLFDRPQPVAGLRRWFTAEAA